MDKNLSFNERQTKKHINFSPDEIKSYLDDVREHIQEDKYSIAQNKNRQKNIDFIENYRIDTKKEKDILLSITYEDFCYAVDNKKEAYSHEKLYVFCKQRELDNWGFLETVDIYIKINITQISEGSFIYIVSFHKRNKSIKYLFRDND